MNSIIHNTRGVFLVCRLSSFFIFSFMFMCLCANELNVHNNSTGFTQVYILATLSAIFPWVFLNNNVSFGFSLITPLSISFAYTRLHTLAFLNNVSFKFLHFSFFPLSFSLSLFLSPLCRHKMRCLRSVCFSCSYTAECPTKIKRWRQQTLSGRLQGGDGEKTRQRWIAIWKGI